MGKILRILLISVAVLMTMWPSTATGNDPVVHAVLFWSQTCPHCHYVIEEVLPPIQQRYGTQFRLLMLENAQPGSAEAYRSAVQRFSVPPQRQGVPALIIGEHMLVGSREIPEQLPGLIEQYLAAGGVDYPPLDGLDQAAGTEMCGPQPCSAAPASEAEATPVPAAPASGAVAPAADALANTLAGAVLVGLAAVLLYAPLTLLRSRTPTGTSYSRSRNATTLAASQRPWWSWLVLGLGLLGLVVASYLAYTKLAHSDVICGPVGDCDAVQVSPYSELLGIPVAILGGLTYLGILFFWAIQAITRGGPAVAMRWVVWGLALIGAAFSFYLTFLEPFVIGAVCVWCLTSAVCMGLILFLVSLELRRGRGVA